ncbi:MAG TPA: hypothetical protein VFK69_02755 [Candidatus Eisenbacteria bacterium]|nr:hypothetical protein [Candidatus Eisenbacteria bacterium]
MPGIGRIGFWAGLAAFTATVGYDVVQILQVVGVVHFPLDEILIFGTSLCIVVPFVFEMLALHHSSPGGQRFWTHAALVFTTMYAVFGTANYAIQLGTVIPAKLRGAGDAVRVLEQTPHSLLWDFDALAYIAMGLALLVIVPVLRHPGIERWARTACLANVVATALAGVVYFHPTYSTRLLMLGFPWGVTAPLSMVLVALALRARGGRSPAEPPRSSPRDLPRPHPAGER